MSFSAADLTVVIPTRGRSDKLRRTLRALASQSERGFEVVVVVDGTDQEVPDLPGVRVLVQEHAGPGVARNLGVRASDRPLVLFIGDDMIPRPGHLAAHLDRHRAHPEPEVAVLGRVVWHPDVPRDRLHRWLDWSTNLFDYRLLEQQDDDDAGWTRFYSSNVSLKRSFFEEVGGFDPDFVYDYEDLDFGYRAGRQGLRLLYQRDAVTEHLHAYDWATVERRWRSHAEGERVMMAKHDWFSPWFHDHIERAMSAPRVPAFWPVVVDYVPHRPGRLRRAVERRADRHYLQRLAPAFLEAWADGSAARGASGAGTIAPT